MITAPGASPRFPLTRDEVHLWLTPTDGRALDGLGAAWDLLDDAERARADRFLVEPPRIEYILSHGLVRRALSDHTGVDPRDFAFGAEERGKPYLTAPAELTGVRLNLSHSRGLAACAIALGRAVGVDVEETLFVRDLDGIAHMVFSPEGRRAFSALEGQARRDYFFAKWTLKEAFVKARGDGLSLDVERVAVTLRDDGSLASMTLDGRSVFPDWQVHRFCPTPHHAGALVIQTLEPSPATVVRHDPVAR